jgi:signal-transduction protein with cAMP-binding, CBS, and nucleotidyltransferase domain
VVLNGSVEISFKGAPAKNFALFQGAHLGLLSCLADRRRSATVRALAPTTFLEFPRQSVLNLMSRESSVKKLINQTAVMRALRLYLCRDVELSTNDLYHLAEKCSLVSYQQDAVIIQSRDQTAALFLVVKGMVTLTVTPNQTLHKDEHSRHFQPILDSGAAA